MYIKKNYLAAQCNFSMKGSHPLNICGSATNKGFKWILLATKLYWVYRWIKSLCIYINCLIPRHCTVYIGEKIFMCMSTCRIPTNKIAFFSNFLGKISAFATNMYMVLAFNNTNSLCSFINCKLMLFFFSLSFFLDSILQ